MPQTCLHLFNGLIFCYPFMSSNSGTIELKFDAPKYIFSTPAGHRLAHSTLRPQLPYDPHDAQLEGICKAVDGVDIMVLTPTGSGKTGYLTMYMLFLLSLAANPELVCRSGSSCNWGRKGRRRHCLEIIGGLSDCCNRMPVSIGI